VALELAAAQGVRSIAFPCISTGACGYPLAAAAQVAVTTVRSVAARLPSLESVTFCCYSSTDLAVYRRLPGNAG